MSIPYPKDQRDNAANRGLDLFCCGVRQVKGKGLLEFVGPQSWSMGAALWRFCHLVHTGTPPAEAFAAVKWPIDWDLKGVN